MTKVLTVNVLLATSAAVFTVWILSPAPSIGRYQHSYLIATLVGWVFAVFGEHVSTALGASGGWEGRKIVDLIVRVIGWILLLFGFGVTLLIRKASA